MAGVTITCATVSTLLAGHSDQYSYTYGDRKCDEGTIFSLSCSAIQSIAANSGTDFDGLTTNSGDLLDPRTLAAAEAIHDFMQNGPGRIGDLISSRRGSNRRAPASALCNSAEFLSMARKWPAMAEIRGSSFERW